MDLVVFEVLPLSFHYYLMPWTFVIFFFLLRSPLLHNKGENSLSVLILKDFIQAWFYFFTEKLSSQRYDIYIYSIYVCICSVTYAPCWQYMSHSTHCRFDCILASVNGCKQIAECKNIYYILYFEIIHISVKERLHCKYNSQQFKLTFLYRFQRQHGDIRLNWEQMLWPWTLSLLCKYKWGRLNTFWFNEKRLCIEAAKRFVEESEQCHMRALCPDTILLKGCVRELQLILCCSLKSLSVDQK